MALKTPEFLYTQKYTAMRDRLMFMHGGQIQAGVWASTDFLVVQRAAGANMQVDIGAGFALVPANDVGNAGLYHVENDAAVTSAVTFATAHATLPRIDQVYVQVDDTVDGGDADDIPQFGIVTGTATSGATLDNRTGAGSLPNGALRLADVLVGAAVTSITTANIRDRRQWARGAYFQIIRTSGDITYSSTTKSLLDATNLQPRIECSGVPLKVRLEGALQHTGTISNIVTDVFVDGAIVGAGRQRQHGNPTTNGWNKSINDEWQIIVAAGSHLIGPAAQAGAVVNHVFFGTSPTPLVFTVEELIRQNANNS